MSAFAAHKLQESVYGVLTASTALNAAVTAVYDEPAAGAVMPYVSLGETSTALADNKSTYGVSVTFAVDVWSDEASQMEAKEIAAIIDGLLHNSALTVVGFDLIFMLFETSKVERITKDTATHHKASITYKARLYKAA